MASIKYKDPITGNMQQITMKVADTLPVGTEVDYDGQTAPAGWQEVAETNLGDVVVDSIRTKNLLDTAKFVAGSSSVSILDAKNGTLEIQSTSGYYSQANQTISIKSNTAYTISYNGVAEQTGSAVVCAIRNLADTATIARQEGSGDKTLTFTTTENGAIIRFMVTAETNTGKTKYTNIQLEEGSSATPYTPYQELDNQEVYSTGETRIGTWIDGKPLYRKVISSTSFLSQYTIVTNADELIKITGVVYRSDYPIAQAIPSRFGETIQLDFGNFEFNTGVMIVKWGSYWVAEKFKKIILIAEYTKTTD